MADNQDVEWHWPDEQLLEPKKKRGLGSYLKYVLAFADEAFIILLLVYMFYRIFN